MMLNAKSSVILLAGCVLTSACAGSVLAESDVKVKTQTHQSTNSDTNSNSPDPHALTRWARVWLRPHAKHTRGDDGHGALFRLMV